MRGESELFKDKIEVNLDGRQVFYLFFGGAVVGCLLFVLGVMVGRRVEARGHIGVAETSAMTDPLAALDQMSGTYDYQTSLSGGGRTVGKVDRTIASLEQGRALASAAAKRVQPAQAVSDAVAAKPESEAAPVSTPAAVEAVKVEAAKVEPAKIEPAKVEPAKVEPAKVEPAKVEPAKSDAVAGEAAKLAFKPSPTKTRYTLQVASFQARAEADALVAALAQTGHKAYVTSSQVEGKGIFFRVRFGNYLSYDESVHAKGEFEKKVGRIAYVTKL